MTLHDVVVALIIVGIPLLLFLSRTHAALAVLALFAGATLARTVGLALVVFINSMVKIQSSITDGVAIFLLIIPALVLAIHYRKSAKSKIFIQLLPATLSGVTALFLLLPLVSPGMQKFLTSTKIYPAILPYQNVLLTGAIVAAMLVCVAMYKRANHDEGGKHGH